MSQDCMRHGLRFRDDGKEINYTKYGIRKTYAKAHRGRIVHLKAIYDKLKRKDVPNVDRLIKVEGCDVVLEPRGINTGPRSASDVKNAVKSLLEALKVVRLHCN